MDDPFQQQALGRANAACCALFAVLERFEGDAQLLKFLNDQAALAEASLLHTGTGDIALAEFQKTIDEFRHRVTKTS